jgi:hypothetical protein
MAQGSAKLSKAKRSAGSQKKAAKHVLSKGRKTYKPKGRKATETRTDVDTTKAINRKNEAVVSAKAMSEGTRFFLTDMKAKGKKELTEQEGARNKKEIKEKKMEDRIKEQLRKLGREV